VSNKNDKTKTPFVSGMVTAAVVTIAHLLVLEISFTVQPDVAQVM